MSDQTEKRERKERLEAHKKNQKKGKGVSGLGNTEEAKGNYMLTAKHTAMNVGAGLAGGMLGIAVGRASLFGGIAMTGLGVFFDVPMLATAGTAMMVGSMAGNNLTTEQRTELDKTHPLKEGEMYNMEREQNRASYAVKNAITSLKNATYFLAEKDEGHDVKKDELPKDANIKTGTAGFGYVPTYKTKKKENEGVELNF